MNCVQFSSPWWVTHSSRGLRVSGQAQHIRFGGAGVDSAVGTLAESDSLDMLRRDDRIRLSKTSFFSVVDARQQRI